MTVIDDNIGGFHWIVNYPNALEILLAIVQQSGRVRGCNVCLTSWYSRQYTGDTTWPCLSMRNLKNGRATFFEKNTRPMAGSTLAKAYRTHRMTKSSNGAACLTNGGWFLAAHQNLSLIKPKGSSKTSVSCKSTCTIAANTIQTLTEEGKALENTVNCTEEPDMPNELRREKCAECEAVHIRHRAKYHGGLAWRAAGSMCQDSVTRET